MTTPKKQLLRILRDSSIDDKTLDGLLTDILTPKEYADLVERAAIFRELIAGKTVKDVSEKLGVASATVVRGNRVLKYGTGTVARLLKK